MSFSDILATSFRQPKICLLDKFTLVFAMMYKRTFLYTLLSDIQLFGGGCITFKTLFFFSVEKYFNSREIHQFANLFTAVWFGIGPR